MSNQASGSNGQILMQYEQNWGVGVGKAVLLTSSLYGESLTASTEELISESINPYGGIMDMKGGQKTAGGGVPFELPLEGAELVFYGLAGAYTQEEVVVSETTLLKKVFKRNKTIPSFTIEKGFTDTQDEQYFKFTGSKINSVSLSVNPEGTVSGSFDVMSKKVIHSNNSVDEQPVQTEHELIRGIDAVVLEGATGAEYLSFDFEIINSLYDARVIGSNESANIGKGRGEVTGSLSIMFKDEDMYNKWANEEQTDIRLTFTVGKKSVEFYFPRVRFTGEGVPMIDTAEGIQVTLNWRSLIDKALGTDFIITTINDFDLDEFLTLTP